MASTIADMAAMVRFSRNPSSEPKSMCRVLLTQSEDNKVTAVDLPWNAEMNGPNLAALDAKCEEMGVMRDGDIFYVGQKIDCVVFLEEKTAGDDDDDGPPPLPTRPVPAAPGV
jgi:hypothetical protein